MSTRMLKKAIEESRENIELELITNPNNWSITKTKTGSKILNLCLGKKKNKESIELKIEYPKEFGIFNEYKVPFLIEKTFLYKGNSILSDLDITMVEVDLPNKKLINLIKDLEDNLIVYKENIINANIKDFNTVVDYLGQKGYNKNKLIKNKLDLLNIVDCALMLNTNEKGDRKIKTLKGIVDFIDSNKGMKEILTEYPEKLGSYMKFEYSKEKEKAVLKNRNKKMKNKI